VTARRPPTRRRESDRSRALLAWFRRTGRPLPWRADRDPYRIWVAEVLLQQTRVAQATPFFERFVRAFPNVGALASASDEEVLKAWQGAGYYARARHLRAAAREVVDRFGGEVPATVADLETLPGVGPYIARAVASLAFNEPVVALEANGLRVAARWTLEREDLTAPATRRRLTAVLESEQPRTAPGAFNEALMELGETVCRPRAPQCERCPVATGCRARLELPDPGRIPAIRRRSPRPNVRAAIVVLEDGGRVLVQRRPPTGLLGGLWEFPGGRIEPGEAPETAARRELREETGLRAGPLEELGVVHHAYSHFSVDLHIFRGPLVGVAPRFSGGRRWLRLSAVGRLALPKATEKVLARLTRAGRASRGSGARPGRTPASRRGGAGSPRVRARRRGTGPSVDRPRVRR